MTTIPQTGPNGNGQPGQSSGYLVYVPERINTGDILDGLGTRFKSQGQSLIYLVDRVHSGMARTGGEPTPICRTIFGKIVGQNNAKPIIDACLKHHVLESDGEFERSEKCRGFVLGEQFEDAKFIYRRLTDPYLLSRLAQSRQCAEAVRKKTWSPWHYRWENWQKALGIDKPLALQLLHGTKEGKDHYSMQTRLIDDIDQGRYRIKLDPRGRLYGNATNVKKDVRPALLLDDEQIEGLDVRNSQPAFLGMLLIRHCVRAIDNYIDMACSGTLYDHLARLLGIERGEAKGLLFQDVFGKKGDYPSEMENVFESEFPSVIRFIRQFNEDDHGALLRELQREEAELVIHRVGMALPKDEPFISIHDGVYCQKGHSDEIQQAFDQALCGYPIVLSAA